MGAVAFGYHVLGEVEAIEVDQDEQPAEVVAVSLQTLVDRLVTLNGFLSVAAGAYGRHGALEQAGREMIGIALNYQMAHGLGLLAVAWLASRHEGGWLTAPNLAGAAFTLGILLFSGSLYWFGLTGLVPMESSAPAGGFLLMFGWLAAMWTVIRHRR